MKTDLRKTCKNNRERDRHRKIFLYIATHPDIESNEVSISNKFMTNITNEDEHYSSLLQSPKIIFEQSEYVIS